MNENNGNGAAGGLQFDEEMCERYIFGELSPADQERFEETYFSDDAFFERYVAVKTELLDLLARGEIEPSKRARMEPHFRETAPRRKRIEETAMFSRSVTAIAQRRADRATGLAVLPPAPTEGIAAGLIRSLSRFFMYPRVVAFAALVLALAGGTYLMNRSFSTDTRQEIAIVSNGLSQREVEQTAKSSEPAIRDRDPGTESAPMASLSSDRAVEDEQILVLRAPRAARSPKGLSKAVQRTTPPSSSPTPPANDRANTGFALTLSTVGRDNGREVGPAPASGLNIGGQRGRQTSPAEGLSQSIVLRPGATRDGGQTNTLVVRSGNDRNWAAITLLFRGKPSAGYVVTITNMSGKVVLKDNDPDVERQSDGSNAVTVWIDDTSTFKEAEKDFIATLQGQTKIGALETIEEYYFHIRRVTPKPAPNDRQLLAAQLSGTVLDPNGAPVPKAVVTAKNLKTGMIRNTMSLVDGSYHMAQLPPGDYEVYAEAASLKRSVGKGVKLIGDNPVELTILMESGGADSLARIENLPIKALRPAITLQPMFASGSVGVKKLELHGDLHVVDFELLAPATLHSSFNTTIKTVGGKTVYSNNLSRKAVVKGIVKLSVPSKLLHAGDHVIQLRGRSRKGRSEPVAEFYFHVQRPD